MAGGTGVGGIKDSQGNFEIIGRGDSSMGTRGGTFLMPIGDAAGQTPGRLSVKLYVSDVDPALASSLSLELVPFTPALPPSAPTLRASPMTWTAGLDTTGSYGVFHLGKPSAADPTGLQYGLFLDYLDVGGRGRQICCGVVGDAFVVETNSAFPNAPDGFGQSALEATFVIKSLSDSGGTLSFFAPCDGYITDVMALIDNALDDVTFTLTLGTGRADLFCTLAAAAPLVRRATNIARSTAPSKPVVSFVQGEEFSVTFPASRSSGSRPLAKICYVRTQSPL